MKLSIRYKLLLSFIGIALLSVPFNIYFILMLSANTKNFVSVTDYQLPALQALLEMKNTTLRTNLFISNFNYNIDQMVANENTPTKLDATKDQLLAFLEDIGEWQNTYQRHLLPSKQSTLNVNQLTALKDSVILKALDVFSAKEKNASEAVLVQKIKALEKSQKNLEQFINLQVDIEAASLEKTKFVALKARHLLKLLITITSIIVLVVAIIIGFILSRWIATPIIALRDFTSNINQDNLDKPTTIYTNDEIGDLALSVNKMLENLSRAKTQIIEASRLAGIAEVTTCVMHNVGNILNSVNTSVSVITKTIKHSQIISLPRVYQLIDTNKGNLSDFINQDERGKFVLPYFDELLHHIDKEQHILKEELTNLNKQLEQIRQVVTMRLSSEAALIGMVETLKISELIEEGLKLQATKIKQNNIEIIRNYEEVGAISSVKSKIQQILVNLIKNAIEALIEGINQNKRLVLNLKKTENEFIHVSIHDNGVGVSQKNIDKIFNFGYTTKENGHGFGLHSCALLAQELGGSITVESEGLERGANFTLEIPDMVT